MLNYVCIRIFFPLTKQKKKKKFKPIKFDQVFHLERYSDF